MLLSFGNFIEASDEDSTYEDDRVCKGELIYDVCARLIASFLFNFVFLGFVLRSLCNFIILASCAKSEWANSRRSSVIVFLLFFKFAFKRLSILAFRAC